MDISLAYHVLNPLEEFQKVIEYLISIFPRSTTSWWISYIQYFIWSIIIFLIICSHSTLILSFWSLFRENWLMKPSVVMITEIVVFFFIYVSLFLTFLSTSYTCSFSHCIFCSNYSVELLICLLYMILVLSMRKRYL